MTWRTHHWTLLLARPWHGQKLPATRPHPAGSMRLVWGAATALAARSRDNTGMRAGLVIDVVDNDHHPFGLEARRAYRVDLHPEGKELTEY
jgi:hypothetical protein